MDKVIHWFKSNLAIVVFALVMILALLLAPIFSGRWNRRVREEAESRASKLSQIDQIERTSVNLVIPGAEPIVLTTAVNRGLLDEYRRIVEEVRGDASQVRERAIAHNRRGRGVLIPRLFPEMPAIERDTLPPEMFDTTLLAYQELVQRVRGGTPPRAEQVIGALVNREEQYISGTLRKRSRSELDATELKDLEQELGRARLARYGEVAQAIGMYLSTDAFALPNVAQRATAREAEMFGWQWNLWVVEDILEALGDANRRVGGAQGSVVVNPVKRVIAIRPMDAIGSGAAPSAGGPQPPAGGQRGTRMGGLGLGGVAGGGASAEPPADPFAALESGADPFAAGGGAPTTTPAPSGGAAKGDFSRSYTGRTTNAIYDVRPVLLRAIVSMEHLPLIIDAISQRNFMTVLDLELRPVDLFAEAAQGFIYGSEPVVDVLMRIETIWLRDWTTEFMPPAVREALGIASPTAAPTDGSTPPL